MLQDGAHFSLNAGWTAYPARITVNACWMRLKVFNELVEVLLMALDRIPYNANTSNDIAMNTILNVIISSVDDPKIVGLVLYIKRAKDFEEGITLMNANEFANGSAISCTALKGSDQPLCVNTT